MDGRLNDFSPEPAPLVWLCSSRDASTTTAPDWMTAAERHRLARLCGGSREDFLASRWLIRRGLAAGSGTPARLCRPGEGRPDASAEPSGWRLSISHSGGLAGCAVSRGTAIGLDIEPLARRPDWRKLVSRWFSPREQAWLLANDEPEAFLRVWTLKEAWLKATGRGIANNLQTLEIAADFTLSGDQSYPHWRASLGHCGDHLISVVYQGLRPPEGRRISGAIDITDPEATGGGTEPVHWLFHQPIRSTSEPL